MSSATYSIYANGYDEKAYARNQNILSSVEPWGNVGSPMPYDGIIYFSSAHNYNAQKLELYLNGTLIAQSGFDAPSTTIVQSASIPFKKGDIFTITGAAILSGYIRYYKLRDYTGR